MGWECHFVTYQLCNIMQLFDLSALQISLHLYSGYSRCSFRVLNKMAYEDCLRCWPWNKYFIQCVKKKNSFQCISFSVTLYNQYSMFCQVCILRHCTDNNDTEPLHQALDVYLSFTYFTFFFFCISKGPTMASIRSFTALIHGS